MSKCIYIISVIVLLAGCMSAPAKEPGDLAKARAIINSCAYASLATCEGDQPRVRPVSVFSCDDGSFLVATVTKTRKVEQLKNNPKVELCFVDDRHRQVRIQGRAELVESIEEKGRLMKQYLSAAMWSQYFKGPDDPLFALYRIRPEHMEWMDSGQIFYRPVDLK